MNPAGSVKSFQINGVELEMVEIKDIEIPRFSPDINNFLSASEVKAALLKIDNGFPNFSLSFARRRDKRTAGQYMPAFFEIVLYPDMVPDNNALLKVAIHEYAHHIDYTVNGYKNRPHTGDFLKLEKYLRNKAYEFGIIEKNNCIEIQEIKKKAAEFGRALFEFQNNTASIEYCKDVQEAIGFLNKTDLRRFVHFSVMEGLISEKEIQR